MEANQLLSFEEVLKLLPYQKPFLFVDTLSELSEERVVGHYTFLSSEYFYKGHFKERPVTPGVILTECMAQIGLVCLGIYLLHLKGNHLVQDNLSVAFAEANMRFLKPVLPNTKVKVMAERTFWRLGKLKCEARMYNEDQEEVARGTLAGMINKTG